MNEEVIIALLVERVKMDRDFINSVPEPFREKVLALAGESE